MNKSKPNRNDAGFTLIELVFAAGVMSVGMVLMMQSIISLNNQARLTDVRVAASHFSHSILESMHDMEFAEIVQFNADGEEFSLTPEGTIIMDGVGEVTVNIYAVISDGGGSFERAPIPVSDADVAQYSAAAPNPLEIQVEILMDAGMGEGNEYKFRASTFVYYQ